MTPPRAGEFDLIARYFAPLARGGRLSAFDLRDDAASLEPRAGHDLVFTADALVADVHFFATDPPDLIARKALRTNLSDLAAKGAHPIGYLLCLALPKAIDEPWIAGFARGLKEDQALFGLALAGGDTTSTPGSLVVAMTAIGEVSTGRMLRRAGAAIGDDIWVSGTIGDGALGLLAARGELDIQDSALAALVDRYRLPRPRLDLGMALAPLGVVAMDVSDGLFQDLGHIIQLAAAGAVIDEASIPLSPAARTALAHRPGLIETIVTGGDDYELLIVAPPTLSRALASAADATRTALTRIGRIVAGDAVQLRGADGQLRRFTKGGWTHF